MVRSLWTGATGMNAQQTNVDTIANNLANVNTTGYKAQNAQFKSLLYQTMQTKTTTANGAPKPTTSQVPSILFLHRVVFWPLPAILLLLLRVTAFLR